MSAHTDRALSFAADALVGLIFWADRKHATWTRIADDKS